MLVLRIKRNTKLHFVDKIQTYLKLHQLVVIVVFVFKGVGLNTESVTELSRLMLR